MFENYRSVIAKNEPRAKTGLRTSSQRTITVMEPASRDDWPLGPALKRARGTMAIREAARRAGISEGRWRQLEVGYQSNGQYRIPISTTAKTVVAAANAVDLDVGAALSAAGFDPREHTNAVDPATESPDLSDMSDDDLIAELCRRLAMRHNKPKNPVPLPLTRAIYAPKRSGVGGDEEGDRRRQLGG